MLLELFRAVVFSAATLLLFGGAYHGLLWGIGRVAFPAQAEGSLIRRADGTVVGSRLIAQRFTRDVYVHPRPSAVDYDASSSGGSNYATSSPDQRKLVRDRLAEVQARERVAAADVPSELVTASGSGLDPHLSPDAVLLQVPRLARARGVSAERVRAIVQAHVEPPLLGLFGQPRVNVLVLNLALDDAFGSPAPSPRP